MYYVHLTATNERAWKRIYFHSHCHLYTSNDFHLLPDLQLEGGVAFKVFSWMGCDTTFICLVVHIKMGCGKKTVIILRKIKDK